MIICGTCCEYLTPVIEFEIEGRVGICSGCGVGGGGTNTTFTREETDCAKGGTFSINYNVAPISELIYSSSKLIDNYAPRLKFTEECFQGHIKQFIYECDFGSSCNPCYPSESFPSPCCEASFVGGTSCCVGLSRPAVKVYSNPVNTCALDFTEWESSPPLSIGSSHSVSVYGNNRTKTISRFRIKNHQPTISCYLKIWFRKRIVRRNIVSKTEPIYGPEVITYEDIPYTYEWIGTGNPCFEDENKIFNDPDNLIENEDSEFIEFETNFLPNEDSLEAFAEWATALNETASEDLGDSEETSWGSSLPRITDGPPFIGGIATAYFEYKYSFVKDYEPEWGTNMPPNS